MQFDVFFSICQTEVDGFTPTEHQMFENFFSQVEVADRLGYQTAWVAETHLSCQIQKTNPAHVIPNFKGEIGLNTDILQLAHLIYARTQKINVGSAIRNILCNGGPIAHAEALKTFMLLKSFGPAAERKFELGFAAGRFPFSNNPYHIKPTNFVEKLLWPALQGKVFMQATEIFLRFLKGETLSSKDIASITVEKKDLRAAGDWDKAIEFLVKVNTNSSTFLAPISSSSKNSFDIPLGIFNGVQASVPKEISSNWGYQRSLPILNKSQDCLFFPAFWEFENIGVIPFTSPLNTLELTIGAHWEQVQNYANTFMPVGVFNLSITPSEQIEKTHSRMQNKYHPSKTWSRSCMPRTVLVFINDDQSLDEKDRRARANARAQAALENYWRAMEGTLDPQKVNTAVHNALVGTPEDIVRAIKERFHSEDRLMLWFDFNNHDNQEVCAAMDTFATKVIKNLI